MFPMTISGFNQRSSAMQQPVAPARPLQQPSVHVKPGPATAAASTGVRAPQREKGEVKDPTWKLQELLEEK